MRLAFLSADGNCTAVALLADHLLYAAKGLSHRERLDPLLAGLVVPPYRDHL